MTDAFSLPEPDVSAEHPVSEHWVWAGAHRPAIPRSFTDRMTQGWASHEIPSHQHPAVARFAARRAALCAALPGKTIVVPSGNYKVRSNDTDYSFRTANDFYYLTGCQDADVVSVITPDADATLYMAPRRDQRTHEFFTNSRYGELWVGPRRDLDEAALFFQIGTAPLDRLEKDLIELDPINVLVDRGIDLGVDALLPVNDDDRLVPLTLSDFRLVKDEYEIAQLQAAVDYSILGFEDVVRALPAARQRGERVIEGVFHLRARVEGNDVGYNTIAASGSNATILHWMTNNGDVRDGDLLLLDAGVEVNELYTADVTRTMPINGTFSPAQRRVYDIVLRAADASIAALKAGVPFSLSHETATRVLVEGLIELGILTDDVETIMRRDVQSYRRYTLHGTSHMLGLDVHDCTVSRDAHGSGELRAGYVMTVEPGLYFQPNDLTVPAEYRGIGVRIEDDVLITTDGCVNMSARLPRDPDEIEAWMAGLWAGGPSDLAR